MARKKTFHQLNVIKECKKYSLSIWECPSFLIILTGLITVLAMLATYFIAIEYADPMIVALIVISVTAVLLVISYLIVQGFEKLAEANRLKSEFVSIASHQLRSPLTGIKWAIALMMSEQTGDLSKEQLDRLETIKESNQRMINLVNDLLNVSRIEQRRLGLKPEKISLEKILRELIEEYTLLAKAKNVNVSLETGKNLPSISIDPQGIKLVLHNLIDNAIRYTKGGGQVGLRLFKRSRFIRCEIEDNGVGIPKEDQKKIFQKFFRSQNVMKYQTEGTGLGLFIAKAIIRGSKGNIGFRSQEGKGSTFWIELPIK